jgi:hypothetical protein
MAAMSPGANHGGTTRYGKLKTGTPAFMVGSPPPRRVFHHAKSPDLTSSASAAQCA